MVLYFGIGMLLDSRIHWQRRKMLRGLAALLSPSNGVIVSAGLLPGLLTVSVTLN